MPQRPTALPETYECSSLRSPQISLDLGLWMFLPLFTTHSHCYAIAGTFVCIATKSIPGSLQSPSTLKYINHYHHESDDQENVNDSAQGVRGDQTE